MPNKSGKGGSSKMYNHPAGSTKPALPGAKPSESEKATSMNKSGGKKFPHRGSAGKAAY
jgi:hypothetical protein